jgi:bifunctional ADP-heptose synthase (sugar kinase/adenylyltransferase)
MAQHNEYETIEGKLLIEEKELNKMLIDAYSDGFMQGQEQEKLNAATQAMRVSTLSGRADDVRRMFANAKARRVRKRSHLIENLDTDEEGSNSASASGPLEEDE